MDGRIVYASDRNRSFIVSPNDNLNITFSNNDCVIISIMIGTTVHNIILIETISNTIYYSIVATNGQVPTITTNGLNLTLTFCNWGYSTVRILSK